jgi:hypothetical protein
LRGLLLTAGKYNLLPEVCVKHHLGKDRERVYPQERLLAFDLCTLWEDLDLLGPILLSRQGLKQLIPTLQPQAVIEQQRGIIRVDLHHCLSPSMVELVQVGRKYG